MLIAHRNGMATSVTLYRWIRMHISKVRANAGQVQLSEIKMLDNGGGVYAWPEGTTCYNTTSHSNSGTFGTEQTPDKLIDGNTSTKMCAIDLGSTNYFGFDIYIDLGECVFDAQKWCKWCWYTADDNPGRDPVTFSLYLSTDAETWIPVDSCADVSITTTRYALAYTGDINLNMEYVKTGLVAWWDGIWNAGTGVHDAAATTWINLITGGTASLPSGFAVKTDCISVSNVNQNLVVSDYSGSVFTIEYVFALSDSDTVRECLFESVAENYGFRYKASSDVQDYWNHNYYTKNLFTRTGNVGIRHYIASSWDGIYSEGSVGRDYVNGVYMTGGSLNGASGNLGGFRIGRSGFTTYQDVCCIRLYSRVLTDDEIANNYAIDKARFNLP